MLVAVEDSDAEVLDTDEDCTDHVSNTKNNWLVTCCGLFIMTTHMNRARNPS